MFYVNKDSVFTLDSIRDSLVIDKRKIYDVINVLTSLRFIRRVLKGHYKWNSIERAQKYVMEIQAQKILTSHNTHNLEHLCLQLISCFPAGTEISSELAIEMLSQRGMDVTEIKNKKIVNVLRIFTTIGIAEAVPSRNFTIVMGSANNISNNLESFSSSASLAKRAVNSHTSERRMNPQIINMNELMKRDKLSPAAREQSEPRKRKSSYENRQIMENYIKSGSIILPKVRIPCPNAFTES